MSGKKMGLTALHGWGRLQEGQLSPRVPRGISISGVLFSALSESGKKKTIIGTRVRSRDG